MSKTVSVFFDTNILESRDSDSLLSFYGLRIPKTPFYDAIQCIDELGSLAEIDCTINTPCGDYIDYVNDLFEDFFASTRNHSRIIESKKDSVTMKRLIELPKQKPPSLSLEVMVKNILMLDLKML